MQDLQVKKFDWQNCIDYQVKILEDVSRTFALTIPQLPDSLREAVGNAYLLCRLADTIEDETKISSEEKMVFGERLIAIVAGTEKSDDFAHDLQNCLSPSASPGEHDLVANTPRIIYITHSFSPVQRRAIERCVAIMTRGMMEFQRNAGTDGLSDIEEMDKYCYVVAGVVGEMLTDLFCAHSSEIEAERSQLFPLSTSFGAGLQMTNILKDMWDDRRRGACWLPREIFEKYGVNLSDVEVGRDNPKLTPGIIELVGIAQEHLRDALTYVTIIPSSEMGIRRHCLWALGMAVLTLRRIYGTPNFIRGKDVKISRRSVKMIILTMNILARSNLALKIFFAVLNRGLPRAT
ncbi:MAG: phytoene/squalene synthase family protein [Aestuariivita sp.]|nr:phytoene/squalene synthase family protein [Aestuariivita sp.]